MTESASQARLRQSLQTLRELGAVPAVLPALDRGIEDLRQALAATVMEEIPAFSESGNPQVLPQLREHSGAHIDELRRLLGGGRTGDLAFVAEHARRRAEQKFPLEYTLHAYRCGHKVLLRWMRDALRTLGGRNTATSESAMVDLAIDYTDTISTIATSAYVAQTRVQAESESDRRNELLSVLLSGYDESDGRVARLLRRAGYLEQRQAFCVAIAQAVDPTEMENPARAQRMAEALTDAVSDLTGRVLVGLRDNTVVAVFSNTRRLSGWTAPQVTLARQVEPLLHKIGPAALIGLSSDAPSTSGIPKALDEARMALDFATVGERVVQFTAIGLRKLLLRAVHDNVQAALPGWIDNFEKVDSKSGSALSRTLRAYADNDMNIQKAARQLAVHPNTLYARMQRIKEATGLDPLTYHGLSELLLAIDCRRY